MNKGSLGKHKIKLVIKPRPSLHDGSCVGEAADGPGHLGQVAPGHNGRRLVVDSDLQGHMAIYKLTKLPKG